MKKILYLLTVTVLLLALVIGGCAKEEPTLEEPTLKTGVIRYGVVTPLSGPAAPWGVPHLRASEMWFDRANAEGGVVIGDTRYTFEAVPYDMKMDPTETVNMVNKLILSDKVRYLTVLDMIAPVIDIMRDAGVLSLNLTGQKICIREDCPLQFHYIPEHAVTAAVLVPAIVENYPNVKTRAGIGPDYLTGHYTQGIMSASCAYFGIETVYQAWYESGTTDFNAILIKLLEYNPDVIDTTGTDPAACGTIIKQARLLGYEGLIVDNGSKGSIHTLIEVAGGPSNIAGFIYWGVEEPDFTPAMVEWEAQYLEKYGPPFDPATIDFGNGALALVDGIRAAKSLDPEAIADALRSPSFEGEHLWGPYRFGAEEVYGLGNEILVPIVFSQVQPDGTDKIFVRVLPEVYVPIAAKIDARSQVD